MVGIFVEEERNQNHRMIVGACEVGDRYRGQLDHYFFHQVAPLKTRRPFQ